MDLMDFLVDIIIHNYIHDSRKSYLSWLCLSLQRVCVNVQCFVRVYCDGYISGRLR